MAVGHLQEDVDAGHPLDERLRILKWPTWLAGVHLGEQVIPSIDEVKREVNYPALKGAASYFIPPLLRRVHRLNGAFRA